MWLGERRSRSGLVEEHDGTAAQGRGTAPRCHIRPRYCSEGGETVLLERLAGGGGGAVPKEDEAPQSKAVASREPLEGEGRAEEGRGAGVLASVRPRRGLLFLFPHCCPHAGLPVVKGAPKLLLRGELCCAPFNMKLTYAI